MYKGGSEELPRKIGIWLLTRACYVTEVVKVKKCDYFWYVRESYWRSKFKDCSKYAWLGFRVIGEHCLTVFNNDLKIEKYDHNLQALLTDCECNVNSGHYLKISNKEFFEVYKQLRKNS